MNWATLECPRCGTRHDFRLDGGEEKQLRRCPDCDRWLVVRAAAADPEPTYRVDSLDAPPTCPVEGCDEVVGADELPPHIIETHDGALG